MAYEDGTPVARPDEKATFDLDENLRRAQEGLKKNSIKKKPKKKSLS